MPSKPEDTSYQTKSPESEILIRKFKNDRQQRIQPVFLRSVHYYRWPQPQKLPGQQHPDGSTYSLPVDYHYVK